MQKARGHTIKVKQPRKKNKLFPEPLLWTASSSKHKWYSQQDVHCLCVYRNQKPFITTGFIHVTDLRQVQVPKLEASSFPCGSLSFAADMSVNFGYVKISTYHSLIGVYPYSETIGTKSIHAESFLGGFFSLVSNLGLGSECLKSCSR